MLLAKSVMLKFTSFFLSVALNWGFLLDDKNPTGAAVSSNQYLTIDDKVHINHELDELRHDHERSLDILTSQLKKRFDDLENRISENRTLSELIRKMLTLEQTNKKLERNNSILQQKFETLERDFSLIQHELNETKLKTIDLKTEITNLHNLQNIHQLQELQGLQKKVQMIDSSINLLKSHELARNQDFLSLYNITSFQINNILRESKTRDVELESFNNSLRSNMYELFNNSESLVEQLRDLIVKKNDDNLRIERSQNKTLVTLLKENTKIALMGCVPSSTSFSAGTAIVFSKILQSSAVRNQSNFRSTGKFTCKVPGLYFITSAIATTTKNVGYQIMKNSNKVIEAWQVSNPGQYTSVTSTANVELNINDTIWITGIDDIDVRGSNSSCITIFKI